MVELHRHHGASRGHKFSIKVVDEHGDCHGVVIVGRPVSRVRDDGVTAEVARLCTDGTPNACSMLYAAAWRTAKAMGYERIGTYILDTEAGTSLRASGWQRVARTTGGTWSCPSRLRTDKAPTVPKVLWERSLRSGTPDGGTTAPGTTASSTPPVGTPAVGTMATGR